jgi:hypothetical protein
MTELAHLLVLLQDEFKQGTEKRSMEEVRNVFRIVVGKSCRKRQFETPTLCWGHRLVWVSQRSMMPIGAPY